MSYLANPVYCVSCKKQIMADAQFCPYCGFDQRAPKNQEMPPEVPQESAPPVYSTQQQAVPPPRTTTASVVYVQNNGTNWWPLAILVTLFSPEGCLEVPIILGALGVGAVGISAIISILPAFCGFIAAGVIFKKKLFPEKYRGWIFYGLIIANILWMVWMGRAKT